MQKLLALLFLTAISTLAFSAPVSSDNERLENILAALLAASKQGRTSIQQQPPPKIDSSLLHSLMSFEDAMTATIDNCRTTALQFQQDISSALKQLIEHTTNSDKINSGLLQSVMEFEKSRSSSMAYCRNTELQLQQQIANVLEQLKKGLTMAA